MGLLLGFMLNRFVRLQNHKNQSHVKFWASAKVTGWRKYYRWPSFHSTAIFVRACNLIARFIDCKYHVLQFGQSENQNPLSYIYNINNLIWPKMTQNETFRDNLKSAFSPIFLLGETLFLRVRGDQFATNRRSLCSILFILEVSPQPVGISGCSFEQWAHAE